MNIPAKAPSGSISACLHHCQGTALVRGIPTTLGSMWIQTAFRHLCLGIDGQGHHLLRRRPGGVRGVNGGGVYRGAAVERRSGGLGERGSAWCVEGGNARPGGRRERDHSLFRIERRRERDNNGLGETTRPEGATIAQVAGTKHVAGAVALFVYGESARVWIQFGETSGRMGVGNWIRRRKTDACPSVRAAIGRARF